MHCIIAYAATRQLNPQALAGLRLPRLMQLLSRLQPEGVEQDRAEPLPSAAMPHERAHGQALGWDLQAPLPWAAWQTGTDLTRAQAWITPCHWQIGMDQVLMLDPADLALSAADSQALLDALLPYLQEDGLQVRWHDALHWHAQGEWLDGWHAPSIDRVIHANVRPWITSGLPGKLVRLHSEMQMLVYSHPVNEDRAARGQLPVNAFWWHGAGRLSAPAMHTAPVLRMDDLRAPALAGDAQAWRSAWQALDAHLPDPDTPGLRLSLCSESAASHWAAHPTGWLGRLRRAFATPDTTAVLQALIEP